MLYIIFLVIICFIFIAKSEYDKDMEYFVDYRGNKYNLYIDILQSIVIGFAFGMLAWFFLGSAIGLFLPKIEIVTEQELIKFSDSQYIPQYIQNDGDDILYMVESNGTFRIETISADDVLIHYQNQKPVVKKHEYKLKEDWWGIWIATEYGFTDKNYSELYLPVEE